MDLRPVHVCNALQSIVHGGEREGEGRKNKKETSPREYPKYHASLLYTQCMDCK